MTDSKPMSSFYLRRTIGSWSGGTRIEIVNWPGSPQPFDPPQGMLTIRVLAGNNPIIDVLETDIVERRREKSARMSEK